MKKMRIYFIVFFLLSAVFSVFGQRVQQSLDTGWFFYKGNIDPGNPPSRGQWETVNLPHCWNASDGLATTDYYRGAGWYRKNLRYMIKRDKKYYLHFEGALEATDVYVNGKKAGAHMGGYTAFTVDITPYLKAGSDNELAVRVDNGTICKDTVPPYSGDFTMWGGLYRDVYLIEADRVHFRMNNYGSKSLFFDTPAVNNESATIVVRAEVTNDSSKRAKFNITASIKDSSGKIVQELSAPIKINKRTDRFFRLETKIKNPDLWSPDKPYLYTVNVSIKDVENKKTLDELTDYLGLRWFSVDHKNGFVLNGKPLKLTGVCRHQDFPGLGSALSNDMQRRDARLIKEMGANFIRIAHYPQDPAFLDACDKEGILAWEEIPIVNYVPDNKVFSTNSKINFKEMILQNYNHPSIVMWGYMNEVLMQAEQEGKKDEARKIETEKRTVALAKELEAIAQEEDPSRLTTTAWHHSQIYNEAHMGDVPKIVGWNMYVGNPTDGFAELGRCMDKDHAEYPDRFLFISEYGIGSDKRVHTLHPSGYDYSIEYQQLFHESYFPQILNRKFIIGSTVWNFIDFGSAFRGESTPHVNNKGLCYANREPKDVYYYYQAMLRHDPVIHIASRDWNEREGTAGREGEPFVNQAVKIYTNLSKVELSLNGKSLGIQSPHNGHTVYEVPFTDGKNILTAKSAVNDSSAMDAVSVEFKVQPYDLRKAGKETAIGVNAGSNCFYTDPQSRFIYEPDQAYRREGSWGYEDDPNLQDSKSSGKSTYSAIQSTAQGPLFQSMREGVKSYRFDVSKGKYEVSLLFTAPDSSPRAFDVSINGTKVIQNLDIAGEYGPLTAVEKTFEVDVADEKGIVVSFLPIKGKAIVCGLKVRRIN